MEISAPYKIWKKKKKKKSCLSPVFRLNSSLIRSDVIVYCLFESNNAGVMATPFKLSQDNIELQFATNHIGM